VTHRRPWLAAGFLVVAAAVSSAVPAGRGNAHAGTADGSRPVVTSVDPALPGIAAGTVFAGEWQVSLSVVSGEALSVLDDNGRPFLRFGSGGVEGDYAAPAWYRSAVVSKLPGLRLPQGVGADTPPDWRLVTRSMSWAWFDPRIRSEPGLVTPAVIDAGVPARLRDFSIPLQAGGRSAHIRGYLEFEPPRGRYRHTLLSPQRPAPGVEVGLLEGQAVPTLTLRNDSDEPVTVLGADGEPFLRAAEAVEANLASPTWVQVGRALGRTPKGVADPGAEPRWERISEGRLTSWTDFRSRPPDSEPQIAGLKPSRAIEVKRWTIPLRIGPRAGEIRGVTEFEPFQPRNRQPGRTGLAVAAAGLLVVAALILGASRIRRRDSRSPR
jgi:hypothetical protein